MRGVGGGDRQVLTSSLCVGHFILDLIEEVCPGGVAKRKYK